MPRTIKVINESVESVVYPQDGCMVRWVGHSGEQFSLSSVTVGPSFMCGSESIQCVLVLYQKRGST